MVELNERAREMTTEIKHGPLYRASLQDQQLASLEWRRTADQDPEVIKYREFMVSYGKASAFDWMNAVNARDRRCRISNIVMKSPSASLS